jgi:hypothetical protein
MSIPTSAGRALLENAASSARDQLFGETAALVVVDLRSGFFRQKAAISLPLDLLWAFTHEQPCVPQASWARPLQGESAAWLLIAEADIRPPKTTAAAINLIL